MREFAHSGIANDRGLLWVVEDIFTKGTVTVAASAGLIGCILLELFWKTSEATHPSELHRAICPLYQL